MAEVTGLRNNALPYPIYGAPWGIVFPRFDEDGDLVTGASTPDAERSLNGDTFADCTNEAVEIATSSGIYYLLLTAAEMTADVVAVIAKSATAGAKTTPVVLYPRKLVTIHSGTSASAGSLTSTIVLDAGASAVDDFYNGMVCIATIDSNVEVRVISDYVGSTKSASVVPDWNVAPDNNDTFVIKLPEGPQLHQANLTHIAGALVSTTTAQLGVNTVQAAGTAWGSGAITAASIASNAIAAAKIASGAITSAKFAAGAIDAAAIANGAIDAATFAADVDAEARGWLGMASADLDTQLDAIVADTNELQGDWTNGGRLDLIIDDILVDTGTTLQAELDGIQADTEDIQAKIGSPSDFGSGTPTLAANLQDIADNGTATFDRSTDSLQAIRDHVGDGTNLTEAGGDGDHLTEAGGTGDHLTAINLPDQTMNITGDITGNLSGSVGSVTGNVGGNVTGSVGSLATQAKADVNAEVDGAIETYHLDHLLAATYDPASKPGAADALLNELIESDAGVSRFTANALEQAPTGGSAPSAADIRAEIDANSTQLAAILDDTDLIDDATSGLAKIATDVAAILVDTGTTLDDLIDAIKAKTDSLTFTQANVVDAHIQYVAGEQVTGAGTEADPWGPA